MTAGRPRKWEGKAKYVTLYVPDFILKASQEMGYKTPSDALYQLVKKEILNNGSSLKDQFIAQDNFSKAAGGPNGGDGPEQIAALEKYLKSLLPSQVNKLKAKAQRGDVRDLLSYQIAIEELCGIWVKPSIILKRFDEVKDGSKSSETN